jgi:hypothetical protein
MVLETALGKHISQVISRPVVCRGGQYSKMKKGGTSWGCLEGPGVVGFVILDVYAHCVQESLGQEQRTGRGGAGAPKDKPMPYGV